jgi:hypothetical protein
MNDILEKNIDELRIEVAMLRERCAQLEIRLALEDFMMSEDFEQLDEISGKVLGSYIQKARADVSAKYQHQRDVEAHPSVKKQSDKISDYYSRKEYTKSGDSKYRKQIDKAREDKYKAMNKIDPNIHKTGSQGAAKRSRGIEKAIKKLTSGKLTN